MNNIIVKNILRFIFLIPLQLLVVNHIQWGSMITPYIYILCIMLLPFDIHKGLLLLCAGFVGLAVDLFSGTLGLHISVCLFLAFIRPALLKFVTFGRDYDADDEPNIDTLGIGLFILYASIMSLIFHLLLNFLEVFSWNEIWVSLLSVILSTIVSLALILVEQLLFAYSRKYRRKR